MTALIVLGAVTGALLSTAAVIWTASLFGEREARS